jgi:hexosaminidase
MPGAAHFVLLPQPRRITRHPGACPPATPVEQRIDRALPGQGYQLWIRPDHIQLTAADAAGLFYANQTLKQIRLQCPSALPCLEIHDHPDFPARGVMLDISRDKVPTMATLFRLVDMLASWKINQLQLYTEHTFAYSRHRDVWKDASPMTADEIRALDAYCSERFIELVPNQNSFGHMERWLKHPAYQHLAESMDGAQTPWGFYRKGPFSLCPTDPASVDLLSELFDELLINFRSHLFNVGCDETYDIGQGRSRDECERIGKTQVYLNFLARVDRMVRSHGRRTMFWGDIILHQPEMIGAVPKEAIALNWGYEADHPFDKECAALAQAGVRFYVCPGTSSWNSIAGRTDNAITSCRSAAEAALKHGAIGYLNTDWGDNGHLQYLPASYLGLAAGAAFGWCAAANADLDFVAALNLHAFGDSASPLGRVAYQLGNVYQACGKLNRNGSTLFRMLVPPPNDAHPEAGLTAAGLDASDAAIAAAMAPLASAKPADGEAALVADEFRNAAAILHHTVELARSKLGLATRRGSVLPGIVAEHRRLWLARNRPGGLADSVARLAPPAGGAGAGWI